MALKDSFINLNKALRTTLQNVPAVVDTLIRGFEEIGDAADAQTTYSTDEHVVGKWIDGSNVYEKVIDIGALPNSTTKTVNHGIENLGRALKIEGGSYNDTNGETVPLNFGTAVRTYVDTTRVVVITSSDRSDATGYVILTYIKSTTNRTPEENDTKNGGDEEPDVKTIEEPAEELKK